MCETRVYKELMKTKVSRVYKIGDDELHFEFENGEHYRFFHVQDCCESVSIDDIEGDLADLEGEILTMAEETSRCGDDSSECGYSETWTFYKFATVKGYVNVKWYGQSNGYYSESVDFEQLN